MSARLSTSLALFAAALALAGVAISGYLVFENLQGDSGICVGAHGCSTVQDSRYGNPFGVPISIPGLATYALLAALAWAWWRDFQGRGELFALGGFLAALGGVLVSAYLTYVEAFVLDAWCSYCIASALLMVALFVVWSAVLTLTLREQERPLYADV